jgi:LuxR family transcriptional regulator, maltose regulon positive regulatory protein
MPDLLLTTKLNIPPLRPETVTRSLLLEQLNTGILQNEGFGRKLTLVSAPAGYGKTTLALKWLKNTDLSVAKKPYWNPFDLRHSMPNRSQRQLGQQ